MTIQYKRRNTSLVKEVWRPLVSFEIFYSISNLGQVKSHHKRSNGRLIKHRLDRGGYLSVRLSVDGKTYTRFLHRLLAETFIPNPLGRPYINHCDGNKLNNNLKNLEWISQANNTKHAYSLGLIKRVEKCVIDTITNKKYKNVKEAALMNGLAYSTCKNYLNGNRPNPTSLRYVVQG